MKLEIIGHRKFLCVDMIHRYVIILEKTSWWKHKSVDYFINVCGIWFYHKNYKRIKNKRYINLLNLYAHVNNIEDKDHIAHTIWEQSILCNS